MLRNSLAIFCASLASSESRSFCGACGVAPSRRNRFVLRSNTRLIASITAATSTPPRSWASRLGL